MPWYYAVVERRHELQNPTSADKIRLLGERLGLGEESHVLDVASGRGGPALILAETFGCRVTCVERAQDFHDAAQGRVRAAGLESRIELVHGDAHAFPLERGRYDAALCLGASFIWNGLAGTLSALAPAVRAAGFVAVGEPYWRRWPLPDGFEPDEGEDFKTLPETVAVFEDWHLAPVTLIASSEDDWDRYETLHWLAADEWLRENGDDPDAAEIRGRVERHRARYLQWERELLGWAIVVGRKP
jgi:SAM-dependent methyltransferase